MKSLLIIGGNGFLGTALLGHPSIKNFKVSSLIRSTPVYPFLNCSYYKLDEYLNFGVEKFDLVINVAMQRSHSSTSNQSILDSNYRIPLQAIRKASTPETVVINTSTYIQHYLGIPNNPIEEYAVAKNLLSRELEMLAKDGNFVLKDLFLFTLFGQSDRQDRFLPSLINSIKSNIDLHMTGGRQLLHLLDVADAADIIFQETLSASNRNEKYRLWNDEYIQLADLVTELVGDRDLVIHWGSKSYKGHEMFEPWPFQLDVHPEFGQYLSPIETLKTYIKESDV